MTWENEETFFFGVAGSASTSQAVFFSDSITTTV